MFTNKTTNNVTTDAASGKKSLKERLAGIAIPAVGVAAIGGAAAGIVHVVRGKRKAAEILDGWEEDDTIQTEQSKPIDPQKEADRKAMESIAAMLDIYEVADDETVLAAGNTFIAAGEAVCTEEFYERNWETNLKLFSRYERMVKRIRDLQDTKNSCNKKYAEMYKQLATDAKACIAVIESTNVDTKLDDLKEVLPLAKSLGERLIDTKFAIFVMERDTRLLNDGYGMYRAVKAEIDFQERKRQRADDIDVDSLAEKMNSSAIPDTVSNTDADAAADLAKAVLKKVNDTIG